ncbi:MAG: prealbumin-like fold domain-containing protein [Clostridium sp.]|nr:prealbumin-like fold domain-containing protein [Clostridium sp.]
MKKALKKTVAVLLAVLMVLLNLPLSALALNGAAITISSNSTSADGIDIDDDVEFDYYVEINGQPFNGEAVGSNAKHYSIVDGILTLPYNVSASITGVEDGSTYSVKRLEYDNLKYALMDETQAQTGDIASKEYYVTVNDGERERITAEEFNAATDNGANLEIVKYYDDKGNVYNDAVEINGYTVTRHQGTSVSYTLDEFSGWAAEEVLETYDFSIHNITCTHSCSITKVLWQNVTTWPWSSSLTGSMSDHDDIVKTQSSSTFSNPTSLSSSISSCLNAIQQDEMRVYYDYSNALAEETGKNIIFLTNALTKTHPDTQVENSNGASTTETYEDITSYAKAVVEVTQEKTVYESVDVDANKEVCFDAEFKAAPTGTFVVDYIIYSGTYPESYDGAAFEIKDALGNPLTEGEDYTLEVSNASVNVLIADIGYTVYKFSGLKMGYYTIQQTLGASGYIVDKNEYAFAVGRDGAVTGDHFATSSFDSKYTALTNNTYSLITTFKVFKNNSFSIEFSKVDQNGDVVPNAKFLMIERDAFLDLVVTLMKSGVDTVGNLNWNDVLEQLQNTDWENIDIGTILGIILSLVNLDEVTLGEITLPAILSTTSNSDGVVSFSNSSNILNILGTLTNNGITGEQLASIIETYFGSIIPEEYMQYLDILASITSVIHVHSGVPAGSYIMVESEAPAGYERNALVYTVIVAADGTAVASAGVIIPVLVDSINSRFGIDLTDILINEEEFEKYKDTLGGAFDTFTKYSTAVIDGVVAFLAGVIGEDNATSEQLMAIRQKIVDYNDQYDDLAAAIGQTISDINSMITDELTTEWRYYDTRLYVDADIVIIDCQGNPLDIDFKITDSDGNEIAPNDDKTVTLPFGEYTITTTENYQLVDEASVSTITVDDASAEYSFILEYHIPSEAIVSTVDPDCENAGSVTTTVKCSVCDTLISENITETDALNHTVVIDDAVAPTCEETGLTEGSHCSVCNKVLVEQEVLDALNHTVVIDEAVAPTCEDTGLTEGSHCSVCNKVLVAQEVLEALDHTVVIDEAVAPTCEETGLTEGSHCSVCNKVFVAQETIDALDHDFDYDNGTITKPSTCVEQGEIVFTCKNDPTHTKVQLLDLAEHESVATVTAPTCTTKGYTTYTCSICGETFVGDYVDALDHTVVVDEAVAPTCEDTGLTEGGHCSVCNKVLVAQEIVDALNHTVVIDEAVAPTCEETGLTEGSHCSVCNKVLVVQKTVDALDHTVVIDEAVAPTCENTGLTEGSHCSVCNKVLVAQKTVDALNHTVVTDEAVAPTCEDTGLTEGSHCSVCNKVLVAQKTVDALNHTVVTDEAVAPTCEDTGLTEGSHCSVCNKVLVAQETVDALDHTVVIDEAVAPTCEETGLTEGSHCSVCNKVLVAQETVDALNHTVVTDEAVAPTCEETGLTEGSHCSVCNKVLVAQKTVDALDHTVVTDEAVAPTCEDTGLTEGSHCSVCNKVLVAQEVLEALDHTVVIDKAVAPTCEETGLTEGSHCSVCNKVLVAQETVDALDHTVVIDEAVAPTCEETGLTEGSHCSVCNKVLVAQEIIDRLPAPEVTETAPTTTNEATTQATTEKTDNVIKNTSKISPATGITTTAGSISITLAASLFVALAAYVIITEKKRKSI